MEIAKGEVVESYIEDFEMNGKKVDLFSREKRLRKRNQNLVCGLCRMMV